MPPSRRAALAIMLSMSVGLAARGCAQPNDAALHVYAASSLTDALNQIGAAYAETGRAQPVFNYAASSILARQIDQGARADLYISADEAWMDYLAERDLIEQDTRTSFLSNRLVLVAPADRPIELSIGRGFDLVGALNGGRLAMADPDGVPAGRYGRAALESLNVWSSVEAVVVRAQNARDALRFVELGEAAAGIVYRTDALIAGDRVRIVGEFPEDSHPRISYPMAVVGGGNAVEARAFQAFLQSETAAAIFTRLGFALQ